MTTETDRSAAPDDSTRAGDLVLAHLHLRLGLLSLARTELETAAAHERIDPTGSVDLAEARWRTGDLAGAGRAANTAIEAGLTDPVALVIASEAAAADGRPSDARRFATQALALVSGSIDPIFAGMPRSTIWPPDVHEPIPSAPTLFERAADHRSTPDAPAVTSQSPTVLPAANQSPAPMTLGLWAGDEGDDPTASTLPEPAEAFDAGRSALVEGAFDEAAFHLGLALRLAPALAPAVLEVTDGARARSLIVVRGDAYRLAGHESEARQAYAVAARGGLPERRSRVRIKAATATPDPIAAVGPTEGTAPDAPPPVEIETPTEVEPDDLPGAEPDDLPGAEPEPEPEREPDA